MTENEGHVWFDLDLAVMEDEALVVLAKECEYGPARDELIVRYGVQTERLICWLAFPQRHNGADVDDARQSAVFWIVEAILKYDTNQIGKPRGCSFRSFVYRVLIARFKDFTKHWRRDERHYDRTNHGFDDATFPVSIDCRLKDPAAIAEAQESMSCLNDALACLDSESRRLWQLLADGNNLRLIAEQLGMSYDSAKRRRRKLIAQLKLRLNLSHEAVDSGSAVRDD